MKLNPLYKKLMLLVIVFGPFFWLVLSEDGRRRADIVLLSIIKGGETFNLALEKLRGDLTETDLLDGFPNVDFSCANHRTSFGNRRCSATIVSFNGAPARGVSAYFADAQLRVVKLIFEPAHYGYVKDYLTRELGEPTEDQTEDAAVYRWQTSGGLIVVPAREPQALEDATIIWLARSAHRPEIGGNTMSSGGLP